MRIVATFLLFGCSLFFSATLLETLAVVPSDGIPEDAQIQPANNNLDVVRYDGRVFLAFRTGPNHFASRNVVMTVLSSEDEQVWRLEGRFHLDRDLREPQLLPTDDGLLLYFALLGTSPTAFEPGGTVVSRYLSPGEWTEPATVFDDDFIPWRIRAAPSGGYEVIGYTGGAGIYDQSGEALSVTWLRSDDGIQWHPAVGDDGVVHVGGGSETDFAYLDDGSLVAVMRNEAGDADGFGSKVCTAPAEDLGSWTCTPDPRKFDSPLVLRAAGRVWLVARRNLNETGHFDLGLDHLNERERYLQNQLAYWQAPKRCALWVVDAHARSVEWVEDLPSAGDTCFPEALDTSSRHEWILYNYSSDPSQGALSWIEGQSGPTTIYRHRVELR